MITSIDIKNFQSHKHSSVEFSSGLNAFIGSGDNGKSAVIKALLWVITNKPDGDEMISHWAKGKSDCVVTVHTNNGYVTRCKGKKNNYYDVNGKKLTAIGRGIPEEVSDFFNLGEINYQTQFEPHFLLTSSDSDVSKTLNAIAKLDIIDYTLSNANTYIRGIKTKEKHLKEDVDSLNQELLAYEGLGKVETLLTKASDIEGSIDKQSASINTINSVIVQLTEVSNLLQAIPNLDDVGTSVNRVEKLVEQINKSDNDERSLGLLIDTLIDIENKLSSFINLQDAQTKIITLEELNSKLDSCNKDISSISNSIEGVITVRRDMITAKKGASVSLSTMENIINRMDSLVAKSKELHTLTQYIEDTTNKMGQISDTLKSKEAEYHELSKGDCPICGGKL